MRMYDVDNNRTLSLAEFEQMWKFLSDMKGLFEGIDTDRSGSVDLKELSGALTSMGYRLSEATFAWLIRAHDHDRTGTASFDQFIALFAQLNILTRVFAKQDTMRTGTIAVSYDVFLQMVLSSM